jgi:kinesin family protein 20
VEVHCSPQLKCQGLADVVLTDEDDGIDLHSLPFEPEARLDDSESPDARAQLTPGVKVDRNFSYAVFVSYVEVYNDKVS